MVKSVKRLAVLGSTGSIGRQTLDVVRALPQYFKVVGLAAGSNLGLLAEQASEFKPDFICAAKKDGLASLINVKCELMPIEVLAGHPDVDIVVIATSGKAGLKPVLAAVKAGKTIAMANKESLVMAGEVVTAELKKSKAKILPVDSEHSAIWQCLHGEERKSARLVLTASGGPFRGYSLARLREVTVEQALQHPSWRMGQKVTIDSATLMNKGLEIIEAHWLFDMAYENIEVVIHPQSIIHSMVEFADGTLKAQLSVPDMRFPIQYALSFPERLPNPGLPHLDWSSVKKFDFELPDDVAFPCLKLAREAGKMGGTYPAALCAADEAVVELFLQKRIGFVDIPRLVEQALEKHRSIAHPTLEDILAADARAKESVLSLAKEAVR